MIHPLRAAAIKDLPGTLREVAKIGFQEVELISFRGFAGPGSREGFGPLAPLSAVEIRNFVRDAGLTTRSAHFRYAEFDDYRIDYSLDWARALGLSYMTIADIGPAANMDEWRRHFERLNQIGERVSKAGMQLGVHTPNELWRRHDGRLAIDALLESVSAANCQIQLELSTAQNNGIDNADFLTRAGTRVFAVHLRDAKTPPQPVTYLAAVPLGQGDLDWRRILSAARKAAVKMHILEINTQGATDPIAGLRASVDYMRRLSVD
jgi:sugar phosphate isomerase/epimerase